MALLVRLAKGLRPGLLGSKEGLGLDILSRVPLAPRQGIAVARFQGRLLLLSYGEGGVRLLKEEMGEVEERGVDSGRREGTGQDTDSLEAPPFLRGPDQVGEGSFPGILNRIRKVSRIGGLALLLLASLGTFRQAGAQTAQGAIQGLTSQEGLNAGALQGTPGGFNAEGATEPSTLSPEGAVFGLLRQLPNMDLQIGEEDGGLQLNGPVGTVLFIGFLTVLPTLLLMMTGFTRILIVLHLLKQAIGTQTAPPTHLLTAMALILTGFVMAPTFSEVNRTALTPWMNGEMDELQMIRTASGPFRSFMLSATREEDLATFMEMHGSPAVASLNNIPMVVVISSFVTSELRHAFQMGFALFLPFVVIDIVVASVLMSMGMFMLPPVMVSLPFKLLLFVLVDGWSLVLSGLVRSFA